MTFEARRVRILEESERVLRNKTLKYVKVLRSQQSEREATWKLESRMREKYFGSVRDRYMVYGFLFHFLLISYTSFVSSNVVKNSRSNSA